MLGMNAITQNRTSQRRPTQSGREPADRHSPYEQDAHFAITNSVASECGTNVARRRNSSLEIAAFPHGA
jgi:hypothetical protein